MEITLEELYQLLGERVVLQYKLEQQLKAALKKLEELEQQRTLRAVGE